MSLNFDFLKTIDCRLVSFAGKAEDFLYLDQRISVFQSGWLLELLVKYMHKDLGLKKPKT